MNADISLALSGNMSHRQAFQPLAKAPSKASIKPEMINAKSILDHANKSNAEEVLAKCHSRMQELGKYLEKAKCKLALAVDFNLGDLFRLFVMREADPDSITRGFIDAGDIARVARMLKVFTP
jgi:hypothetical protein